MKIQIKDLAQEDAKDKDLSLMDIFVELLEVHDTIYMVDIENVHFIIKPLGRKDYVDIITQEGLSGFAKEEVICETATLHPVGYDFSICDAGIPSKLSEEILERSYLNKNDEKRTDLMNFYRSEMFHLHNQINCLIAEAFPQYEFNEIENWPMERALKFLSRSEWILQNLRGLEMNFDPFTGKPWEAENPSGPITPTPTPTTPATPITPATPTTTPTTATSTSKVIQSFENTDDDPYKFIAGETIQERLARTENAGTKKRAIDPEKLRRLQAQFPEIDWTQKPKIEDFDVEVDTISPALR